MESKEIRRLARAYAENQIRAFLSVFPDLVNVFRSTPRADWPAAGPAPAPAPETKRRRRRMSADARKRIAEKTRRRWAAAKRAGRNSLGAR